MNPSLVLVQHRKIRLYLTERLLIGRKESTQIDVLYICIYFMSFMEGHMVEKPIG